MNKNTDRNYSQAFPGYMNKNTIFDDRKTYYVEPLSVSEESHLYPITVEAENEELARQAACEHYNIPTGYRNAGIFFACRE